MCDNHFYQSQAMTRFSKSTPSSIWQLASESFTTAHSSVDRGANLAVVEYRFAETLPNNPTIHLALSKIHHMLDIQVDQESIGNALSTTDLEILLVLFATYQIMNCYD